MPKYLDDKKVTKDNWDEMVSKAEKIITASNWPTVPKTLFGLGVSRVKYKNGTHDKTTSNFCALLDELVSYALEEDITGKHAKNTLAGSAMNKYLAKKFDDHKEEVINVSAIPNISIDFHNASQNRLKVPKSDKNKKEE